MTGFRLRDSMRYIQMRLPYSACLIALLGSKISQAQPCIRSGALAEVMNMLGFSRRKEYTCKLV